MSAQLKRLAFLATCARLTPDAEAVRAIRMAAEDVDDWGEVVWLAEDHGLVPLVRRHARTLGLSVPSRAQQQMTASALRHREASRVHAATLVDIVRALGGRSVEHVVLKGAVLAFDVYPEPGLRPRKDIDLLVRPDQAGPAVTALKAIGFTDSPDPQPHGVHHHLPALVCAREGFSISVEIHTDAISHDQPDSLTMARMTGAARSIEVSGVAMPALGHVDMLRHLTAHLLQPGEQTRMIGVVDLLEYSARHADAVDWDRLRRTWPRVTNTITLLHYLVPLPAALAALRPHSDTVAPAGVGVGFPPLGTVRRSPREWTALWRQLVYPSPWWLHAYYGVPPGRSLSGTRWFRHAPRVAYWAWRRVAQR